jgi:hypothetical protein
MLYMRENETANIIIKHLILPLLVVVQMKNNFRTSVPENNCAYCMQKLHMCVYKLYWLFSLSQKAQDSTVSTDVCGM